MPFLLDQPPVNFRDRPILFIDLEMTGLDVGSHEIIEAAALLVRPSDLQITNSYYTKVLPVHIKSADPRALKLIGYSPSTWKEAITLRGMLVDLAALAPNCLLAGWCVQNEWDFLTAALSAEKLPIFYSHYLLEVFTLAYAKMFKHPDINNLNLSQAARVLGIHLDQHKPDSDIRATYEIFKKLLV